MAEFIIVALPFLFVGMGSIELAHWMYTRQAVSLALLDAGRAAITHHNHADSIVTAFETSLRPLYASAGHDTTQRLEQALAQRQHRMGDAPWQIEALSPSATSFQDFADPDLDVAGTSGQAVINNNYQAEQDARYRALGWPEGRGPVSGQTVFEANTAVLRLTWPHEPRLPLVVPLLRALGDAQGDYRQRALASGYLPIARQITLTMQSHPVQWSNSADGKVIYGSEAGGSQSCKGWLCGERLALQPLKDVVQETVATQGLDADKPGGPSGAGDGASGSAEGRSGDDGMHPDLVVNADDPACGVILCCG